MIDCVAYYFIIPKNIGKNFNDKKIPKVRKNRPAITEIIVRALTFLIKIYTAGCLGSTYMLYTFPVIIFRFNCL